MEERIRSYEYTFKNLKKRMKMKSQVCYERTSTLLVVQQSLSVTKQMMKMYERKFESEKSDKEASLNECMSVTVA
jgi:transposase